jgi:hypothetical protein
MDFTTYITYEPDGKGIFFKSCVYFEDVYDFWFP